MLQSLNAADNNATMTLSIGLLAYYLGVLLSCKMSFWQGRSVKQSNQNQAQPSKRSRGRQLKIISQIIYLVYSDRFSKYVKYLFL